MCQIYSPMLDARGGALQISVAQMQWRTSSRASSRELMNASGRGVVEVAAPRRPTKPRRLPTAAPPPRLPAAAPSSLRRSRRPGLDRSRQPARRRCVCLFFLDAGGGRCVWHVSCGGGPNDKAQMTCGAAHVCYKFVQVTSVCYKCLFILGNKRIRPNVLYAPRA